MRQCTTYGRGSSPGTSSREVGSSGAGRDPKPFPPPMKLCKEMVEVMGGADGDAYRHFRTLACEVALARLSVDPSAFFYWEHLP